MATHACRISYLLAVLLSASASVGEVLFDRVAIQVSANAGSDSNSASSTVLGGPPVSVVAAELNGLAGEALASSTAATSLFQNARGDDTTLTVDVGAFASAVGSDSAGALFSANASALVTVGFTLGAEHRLVVDGDNYFDALRNTGSNQPIDLLSATHLGAGSYELVIDEGASAEDSSSDHSGYLSLRLFTVPEPGHATLLLTGLLAIGLRDRRVVTHQWR